jgi:hypothetical protein
MNAFWSGRIPFSELLESFGGKALFGPIAFRIFPDLSSGIAAEWILHQFLDSRDTRLEWNPLITLKDIGRWLIAAPVPWVKAVPGYALAHLPGFYRHVHQAEPVPHLDSDQLFAVWALLAVMLEASGKQSEMRWNELGPVLDNEISLLRPLLIQRFKPAGDLLIPDAMLVDAGVGLREEQKTFIDRWNKKEIDLVGSKKK